MIVDLERLVDLLRETEVEVGVERERAEAAERRSDRRLWSAVELSPSLEVCEALLAGVPVPAKRLDERWRRVLRLTGEIVVDDEIAFRMQAYGSVRRSA